VHRVTADIRIDWLATDKGWPIAAGFLGTTPGATDFNQGIQAVIYADRANRWHLFVKRNLSVGQDQIITGATWKRGEWYNLSVAFDSTTGAIEASVINASTGELEGSRSRFVATWIGNKDIFDAVAFYDGEYATEDKAGALTTVDNINYVPAPSSLVPMLGGAALLTRRQRR
jgi:hypothetical protein